jgi:hypothetical protein
LFGETKCRIGERNIAGVSAAKRNITRNGSRRAIAVQPVGEPLLRKAREDGRLTKLAIDPLLPIKLFWDIGIQDATAIWVAQFVGERINLIDYIEYTGQPPSTPQEESVLPESPSNVTGTQPLTRPDCEEAGSPWNENSNVCE